MSSNPTADLSLTGTARVSAGSGSLPDAGTRIQAPIPKRAGIFAVAAVMLCVLVPGLLGGWEVAERTGTKGSMILQIMITAWAGLRLSKLWTRAEPRPVAIVFWLYVYVWLGIAGLLQIVNQDAPWPIALSSSAVLRGQIIILLGMAALEFGHLFPDRSGRQLLFRRQLVGSRITVLVAFVLITAPFWYQELGGFHTLFSSRQEFAATVYGSGLGRAQSLAAGGIKLGLGTVPIFLALYAVIVTRQYNAWHRSRLVLLLLVVVAFILDSPVSMPRFWLATMLIALIFAAPIVQKRVAVTRIVIAGAVCASILLFPYAAFFRYSSGFKQPPGIVKTLTGTGDYDSFEMISAGGQYTVEAGYRYGGQLVGDLFFFVPRSTWSSKPEDTGAFIGNHFGLKYTNLSAPLWTEMFVDFGYIGVILVFFLYGVMMRRADDSFITGNSPFIRFAVPLIAGYSCILLRGALLQAMARLAIIITIIWLISVRAESNTSESQDISY